jgi:hypothetical protein
MLSEAPATIFTLTGDPPPDEPVANEPLVELRPGALITGSVREVCFLRKFSGGGAVLHVDSERVVGDRLELELMSGQRLSGTVTWRRGSDVGLAFDAPVDVFGVIVSDLVSQPGERRRMPRVELSCAAVVETAHGSDIVTTLDVSQGGVKIKCDREFAPEEKVTVALDGFRPVSGRVRWRGQGLAGIAFDDELGWQELVPWLRERRDAALKRAGGTTPKPLRPGAPLSEATVQLNLPARIREGTRRWNIEVSSISTRHVEFESFATTRIGTLLWLILPGLEGWPARITEIDGYLFTCEFTQPLHPAVLERVMAAAGKLPSDR